MPWFGFFFGPSLYWYPYWSGYWWWWDGSYGRWNYWYGGYWWWYGPGGTVYIDVNNQYIPYDQYADQSDVNDMPTPPPAPASTPPASAGAQTPASPGNAWKSPDGTRMVQVTEGGAFLFDESTNPPSLIKTLPSKDVEKVRFSGGKVGRPLQILLDYQDGSFVVLDANGEVLS